MGALTLRLLRWQWNGGRAKSKTKLCALKLALQHRDEMHGGKTEVRRPQLAACNISPFVAPLPFCPSPSYAP